MYLCSCRLLEEERRKLNELMLLQRNLEAPVQTENSQDETQEEEEEEGNDVSPSESVTTPAVPLSSHPETTTCSTQVPAQTEETHRYSVEVFIRDKS